MQLYSHVRNVLWFLNHLGYFWIKSKLTYLHCPTVVHNVDGFLCLHFAFKRQKGTT